MHLLGRGLYSASYSALRLAGGSQSLAVIRRVDASPNMIGRMQSVKFEVDVDLVLHVFALSDSVERVSVRYGIFLASKQVL